ncbi:DUF202 domain-containing protein [Mycobacterium ahvazicum]|uniref:DUF202 domain-containing protein n=1 Tax=Mycobacterium ahvazicum TaxID=1964395 RepID=A0A2K4Y3K9_9MYCO|nr:DUF202 domain-containing protein [Mycobacterium ahvazicum]SOX51373.1 DUF202 domain-containing protein [Mycobacterium ahvazicum]
MIHSAATSPDRGMQPERTALSWTRTSLSVVASGVFIVLKDRTVTDPNGSTVRLGIGSAAALLALTVFAVGIRRRRTLTVRPLPPQLCARAAVPIVAVLVVALTVVVVAYLALGV